LRKSASKSKISSNERTGFLVILSAPSGCGKTSLADRLLKRHPDWGRSVSVTTRPPRPGEKNGRDYHFVTSRQFRSLRGKRQFLEWARVFDYDYGTDKKIVDEASKKGRIILLVIDIQGSRTLRRVLKKKIPFLSIFVLPPSITALRDRLTHRSTESPKEIERRIERAKKEIKAAKEYDGTVINHDLDQTVRELEALIAGFQKRLQEKNQKKKEEK